MRHVIFAVVLVGASFLGGAFVNGPGLKWLQVKVLGHAGMSEDVPSLTLPAAVATGDDSGPGGRTLPSPPLAENAPSSSKPSLKANGPTARKTAGVGGSRVGSPSGSSLASTGPDAGAPRPEPEPQPESGSKSGLGNMLGSLLSLGDAAAAAQPAGAISSPTPSKDVTPAGAPKSKFPSSQPSGTPPIALASNRAKSGGTTPGVTGPGQSPVPGPLPESLGRPAPLDPSVTPAFLASLGANSPPAKVPVVQASASSEPRPLPLAMPLPPEDSAAASPSPGPDPTRDADAWGTIRRKLRSLGVTRYTIEGEPGGRVSFSCLIPLAGRQAVTQRFEAEGDDEIGAARAALRRIALWQATERDRSAR